MSERARGCGLFFGCGAVETGLLSCGASPLSVTDSDTVFLYETNKTYTWKKVDEASSYIASFYLSQLKTYILYQVVEEVQSIVACGAGTVTKRVFEDEHIERCDNVKDVGLYIEKNEEMLERKRQLFNV